MSGRRQLYVPAEMENNSIEKCCDQMKKNYWFLNMRAKTQKYIENCIHCIMYAAPVRISEQNLYSIPKRPIPFDTICVHLDHFGSLPSLTSKRKHIL